MKNWKTTVFGILGAAGVFAVKIITKKPIDASDITTAISILGLGAVAKDNNVTGGTVKQDSGKTFFGKIIQGIFGGK